MLRYLDFLYASVNDVRFFNGSRQYTIRSQFSQLSFIVFNQPFPPLLRAVSILLHDFGESRLRLVEDVILGLSVFLLGRRAKLLLLLWLVMTMRECM